MYPYFIWNGVDSRTRKIWINELPPIVRPEERVERVEIPGRPGDVTLKEGDKDEPVYKAYDRQMILTARNEDDYKFLLDWLRGSGPVVFSNEPEREYTAEISSVQFQRDGNTLRRGLVIFHCQPYKAQIPREGIITVTSSVTINNPGNVRSRPIIALTGTGAASITMGKQTMSFTSLAGEIEIDCEAEIMQAPETWNGVWSGSYIRIPRGISAITVSGCTADTLPRWRWV